MRQISDAQLAIWKSGNYTGLNKPMQRATIQPLQLGVNSYGVDVYAEYMFAQAVVPVELPNLKSVTYDRHVDTDAATCKIQLYNTKPLPPGTAVERDDFGNYIFDEPGYYTFTRGTTTTTRWHHVPNEWQGLLAPDRVIRTFEGYGFDPTVGPEFDPNQTQSGVWIIDTVEYDAEGLITLSCRDGGRILIDSMIFPPVVSKPRYPLMFTSYHNVNNTPGDAAGTTWTQPSYETDSSGAHEGPDQDIAGHHAHDAFDASLSSYWLSIGYNDADGPAGYEWIQGSFPSQSVKAVEVNVRGGPYVCYVSLWTTYNPGDPTHPVAARWGGALNIPYDPTSSSTPNGANIKYEHSFTVPANSRFVMPIGDTILDCTKVRLTFHHLYNSHVSTPAWSTQTYRAAVYRTRVSENYAYEDGSGTHVEGDYGDYSEIVKRLLAYGGFHWPNDPAQSFQTLSDSSHVPIMPPSDDPYLGTGRIWGDIMDAGVAAIAGTTLDPTVWDKKSLMDGIGYVRDTIGFNFYVDETGGAVFRMPNVWRVGNYVGDAASGPAYVEGVDNLIVIDENETLQSLSVTLSSHNIRERVFVMNTSGQLGATAPGHTGPAGPFDSNLRRVGGWSDQNFQVQAECNIMADMISLRQLFTYRTDRLTIPGNSAIQIDDQVRILEQVTSEDFIHYVNGVSSSWDIETGEWTYTLDTHWLGESPFDNWVFSPDDFKDDTILFLQANNSL